MTEENQNAIVDELHALNLNLQELINVLKYNAKDTQPDRGEVAPKFYESATARILQYNESHTTGGK
jgi:hypothetical protein